MSATERWAARDLVYSNCHRKHAIRRYLPEQVAASLTMQDLDGVEYCCHCKRAVALIEVAKDVGQSMATKNVEVLQLMARRLEIPGLLFFYRVAEDRQVADGNGGFMPDIDRYRAQMFAPQETAEVELEPAQYAAWIARLHELCPCQSSTEV